MGDPLEDYMRLLRVQGRLSGPALSVRPLPLDGLVRRIDFEAVHPWQHVVDRFRQGDGATRQIGQHDVLGEVYWNSTRPYGQNDGAVWQGRGSTVAVSTGAFVRYGVLSAGLRPRFIYTANRPFDLSELPVAERRSPYAYPLRADIDMPQRFGPDPYTTLELGQSYLQAAYKGVAAGLSTQNLWWGPALHNPIVMSNHAPGLPHVFLGTSGPVDIRVGQLQGRWIWANMEESAYFDDDARNDRRFLTGIVLDYTPRWVPGLSVGMSQTLMLNFLTRKRFFRDYLGVFNLPLIDNGRVSNLEPDDKILSIFGNWAFPESGFEFYLEWARGDHSEDLRDLWIEPDHARAYTAGFQKVFEVQRRFWVRLQAEHTMLESPRERGEREDRQEVSSYFYTHEGIKQGYTQYGQVIGAGIGPGANSQYVGLDLFAPWGKVGVFGARLARDNDRHYTYLDGALQWWRYEVELSTGGEFMLFYRAFEVGGRLTYARLLNKDYVFKNDESNVNLAFTLRYALSGYR